MMTCCKFSYCVGVDISYFIVGVLACVNLWAYQTCGNMIMIYFWLVPRVFGVALFSFLVRAVAFGHYLYIPVPVS